MSNTLAISGVGFRKWALVAAIAVGLLLVAIIGARYAAAVAPSDYGLKEGQTISAAGSDDPDVYIVNDWGYKRLFLNPVIFGFYGHLGGFAKVKSVTPATRDAFPTSGLFQLSGDKKVYGLESTGEDTGVLHWVNTTGAQAVADDPNFFKKVFIINQNEFNWYTKGADYTSVSQVPSYVRVAGATPTPTPGVVTASLAPNNPAATTVTTNAQGVEYVRVRLSGTGTVTGLTVKRLGAGSTSDFSNIYVYDGARRLVSGKTLSSSTGETTFSSGLSVAVSGTKDISIVGDLSATAGNVDYIQVKAMTLSSGTVSGLPISGNNITVSGASSGTITLAKVGSIGSPNVGQANAQLSEFKLTANTEAASVKRIQMIQGGTVKPSDLTNLKLKTGSNSWSGTINSAGEIVFDLGSGFTIAKGGNTIFDVYGDVAGKKDETIKLYFEYATDILAVGDQYGFGMAATITAMDTAAEAFALTLTGGVLTVSFVGPTAADVGTTTDNTTFLEFNMSAATNIEIRKTRVLIATDSGGNGTWDTFSAAASTSMQDLDDIKIINKDSGAILAGPVDGSSFTSAAYGNNPSATAAAGYQYTDVIDMTGGQTIHAAITADIKTANTRTGQALASTDKVAMGVANYANSTYLGVTYLKYAGTNTALAATDIVPNANVWGPAMTLTSSALTVGLSSNPASQTAIQGASNIDAVGLTFKAANSSDLKVTDITVTGYTDADNSGAFANNSGAIATMVSSVALYEKESGALISNSPTTNSLANTTASTVVFKSLNWVIPAGSTKTLLVRATLLNLAPGSYPYFSFDIANPSTDVTALDSSSNTVTPSATTGPNVYTGPSVVVTYSSAGSIYVTEYESSPSLSKKSVYWGQTGVTLAQFKVRTVNEGFYISRFNLVGVGANDKANIKNVYLSYLDKNGNTLTTTGQPLTADSVPSTSFGFSGDSRPYIPADTSRVITVKVDTIGTYALGATSGVTVKLSFSGGNADEFEAIGAGSQSTINGSNANIVDRTATNGAYVYRGFPKIAQVTLPDGQASGQVVVGKFDITAMGYDVLFGTTAAASGSLVFDTLSSGSIGVSSPSFTLYDDATNIVLSTATLDANTKNASVSFTTFTNAFSIPAGTKKTVRVVGNLSRFTTPAQTTSPALGADYFQLILQDQSSVIKWVDSAKADANANAANVAGYLETLPAYGPWLIGK